MKQPVSSIAESVPQNQAWGTEVTKSGCLPHCGFCLLLPFLVLSEPQDGRCKTSRPVHSAGVLIKQLSRETLVTQIYKWCLCLLWNMAKFIENLFYLSELQFPISAKEHSAQVPFLSSGF